MISSAVVAFVAVKSVITFSAAGFASASFVSGVDVIGADGNFAITRDTGTSTVFPSNVNLMVPVIFPVAASVAKFLLKSGMVTVIP